MNDKARRSDADTGNPSSSDQHEGKLPAEHEEGERTRERLVFSPRVDIHETENALVMTADLPGVRPDDMTVHIEKRILTIHGRVADIAPKGYSPLYQEYEIGDYERRFTLAGDFDAGHVEADFEDGVLRLTIPKAPEPEARRVQIRRSGS
jgi:HSP20 family protein